MIRQVLPRDLGEEGALTEVSSGNVAERHAVLRRFSVVPYAISELKGSIHMSTTFRSIISDLEAGRISRRTFAQMAAAMGIAPALISVVTTRVAAQDATPMDEAGDDVFATDGSPNAEGTENQTRGAGGEVRIIQYQAPTILSPHVATGYKDYDASRIVMEPLLDYLPDARLYGVLLDEVPSLENGMLAEDGLSVTFRLKEGLLWSDGEPVTAEDIKFTVEWVLNPENAATARGSYEIISSVDVQDERTAIINFKEPNPFWFEPFTSYTNGPLYPKHILEKDGAHESFVVNPVGTGPYKVESFTPNDEVIYVMNENYRHPNKPYFDRVYLKGGGDAPAAARSVLQTEEFDFAWGPQVEPDVLQAMLDEGKGVLVPVSPVNVERMAINHSDPWTEVDGQISEMNTPHPILSDPAVRKAMSIAVDRQLIADEFYGLGATAAKDVINGDPVLNSPNTEYVFDTVAAAQVLEDAGWTLDGNVRSKDGVELSLVFASPTASRRQKTQSMVKQNLESIGFKIQLETIDSGLFFDASAGNPQSFNKFPWDLMLYIMPQGGVRPLSYMEQWYSGPNRENVAQKSNDWSGSNNIRWINDEYDELWRSTRAETNPDTLVEKFIQMNDMVMSDNAIVPLVVVGGGSVASNRLRLKNLISGSFSGSYANIANWNEAE